MASLNPWRLFVFNLSTGAIIGELEDVRDLRMSFSLSKHPTLGFATGYKHWLTDELVGLPGTDPYRGILAYRGSSLQFAGPVLATDESASAGGQELATISAIGAGWRLSKRISYSSAGAGRTEDGLTFALIDRGLLSAQLIQNSNTIDGNSWIRAANGDQTASSSIAIVKEEPMMPISQFIDKLGNSLDGFDWVITPAFTTDGTGLVLGNYKSAPNYGTDRRDSVVFEYGIGRFNVESAGRKRSIEGLLNKASYAASGQNPYLSEALAPDMIGAIGVFEEAISGDLLDPTLRQKLVDLHVAIRRKARVLYEFVPFRSDQAGPVPAPFVDYNIGDTVSTRAAWGDKVRLEAAMRIYGMDIEISNDKSERVKLDLYMD